MMKTPFNNAIANTPAEGMALLSSGQVY